MRTYHGVAAVPALGLGGGAQAAGGGGGVLCGWGVWVGGGGGERPLISLAHGHIMSIMLSHYALPACEASTNEISFNHTKRNGVDLGVEVDHGALEHREARQRLLIVYSGG